MIFHQYITHFVLESLQKAHSCSYLYTSYVSYTRLKTYFFAFDKSNIPGFSPNFRFRKPVLKFAFNHNTTLIIMRNTWWAVFTKENTAFKEPLSFKFFACRAHLKMIQEWHLCLKMITPVILCKSVKLLTHATMLPLLYTIIRVTCVIAFHVSQFLLTQEHLVNPSKG